MRPHGSNRIASSGAHAATSWTTLSFGSYLEVTPHSRLVWTNDEGDNGKTVTTVTFRENAGKTSLVVHDLYPSSEALDTGSTGALPESLNQLDELLASLGASAAIN